MRPRVFRSPGLTGSSEGLAAGKAPWGWCARFACITLAGTLSVALLLEQPGTGPDQLSTKLASDQRSALSPADQLARTTVATAPPRDHVGAGSRDARTSPAKSTALRSRVQLARPEPVDAGTPRLANESRNLGEEALRPTPGQRSREAEDSAEHAIQPHKLDLFLRQALRRDHTAPLRVIVQTKPGTRGEKLRRLVEGGRPVHADHPLIDGFTTTLSPTDLAALSRDPDIERLSVDAVVRTSAESFTSGDVLRETLGILPGGGVGVDGVSWTGRGVGVALVDSGIEPSVDIERARIVAFIDFTRGGRLAHPYDDYGHGTHVAGLIGGTGHWSDGTYVGAASEAHFVGFKVVNSQGVGYTSAVIAAIEVAIELQSALRIGVMNLSLGHPIYEPAATDPLVRAVERAVAAGLVVVVSAGNYGRNPTTGEIGYGGITSPANSPSAIAVGALDLNNTVTRADDFVPWYSSRGPTWYDAYAKPDLVAPAHRLVAVAAKEGSLAEELPELVVQWADHKGTNAAVPRYMRLTGTSMAAGVTAGAAAVLLGANQSSDAPPLTPNTVKAILQFTALPLPDADTLTQGSGTLNPVGAVRLAHAIDTTTFAGERWLSTPMSPVEPSAGDTLIWSQRLIWGDQLIWGEAIYWNERAWALGVVWGDRLIWGNRLIWGAADTSVVWGDRLIWGNRLIWGDNVLGFETGGGVLLYGDAIPWSDVTAERLIWGDLTTGVASDIGSSVFSP